MQNKDNHLASDTLKPLTDAGSARVREKEKAYLTEIIAKVNDARQNGMGFDSCFSFIGRL